MTVVETLLSPSVPEGKILYHYTTQEGLLGILAKKQLWVSSVLHLNDAAEFNYTVSLVRENVNQRLEKKREPYRAVYNELLKGLRRLEKMSLFVGSFSERGDSLSQWRAYTHNGIGFSLGFEYQYLRNCAEKQNYQLRRCNYEKEVHGQVIEELVAIVRGKVGRSETRLALHWLYSELVRIAPLLKHPSFAEEKEWRLISRSAPQLALRHEEGVLFRSGKSMLIPYREFSLLNNSGKMELEHVVVGPTPHKDLSRQSLSHLLDIAGLARTPAVRLSAVPYRAW